VSANREDLIRHWRVRANEAIEEADVMVQMGHVPTGVSRLYYACFYAATALLLRQDFSSSKHSGVLAHFNREFVRAGVVPCDIALVYDELFHGRQSADYRALAVFSEEQVQRWRSGASQFALQVTRLLASSPPGIPPDA
jgi:uncharacterized protein (UPF0332 family)